MTDLIAKHGGYKNLKSFQMAEIVFDLTAEFVKRYVPPKSRTCDQMEQAARSGKQNIGEGSQASGYSKQTELKLVGVARSSLEELKIDYLDFLRTHDLPVWNKNDRRALAIRQLAHRSNKSYTTYMSYMSNSETAANCLLCLINQANYLLDQQMKSLEKDLVNHGDFKDRYKQVRKTRMMGADENFDEFLKSQILKRLENGRVVVNE